MKAFWVYPHDWLLWFHRYSWSFSSVPNSIIYTWYSRQEQQRNSEDLILAKTKMKSVRLTDFLNFVRVDYLLTFWKFKNSYISAWKFQILRKWIGFELPVWYEIFAIGGATNYNLAWYQCFSTSKFTLWDVKTSSSLLPPAGHALPVRAFCLLEGKSTLNFTPSVCLSRISFLFWVTLQSVISDRVSCLSLERSPEVILPIE